MACHMNTFSPMQHCHATAILPHGCDKAVHSRRRQPWAACISVVGIARVRPIWKEVCGPFSIFVYFAGWPQRSYRGRESSSFLPIWSLSTMAVAEGLGGSRCASWSQQSEAGGTPLTHGSAAHACCLSLVAGMAFKELPEDWACPTCGAAQNTFKSMGREVAGFVQNQQYGLGTNAMTGSQKSLLIWGSLGAFFMLFMSGYFLD